MSSMQVSLVERRAYLGALMAVVAADGVLDKQEVLKLYELFSLLGIDVYERRKLFERLVVSPASFKGEGVAPELLANDELKISLAKDLSLMQERSANNASLSAAKRLLSSINLTPDQANVIRKFIYFENQILAALGAGEEWQADEDSWKELVSHAAAVGVPLAALNVAGVAGFSAAGITSGLAALGGMSGLALLGLNPMTAGIGALILGGVAVKKIADYVAGSGDDSEANQVEEFKKARLLAKEAISSDLMVLARPRKREILMLSRKRRRDVLRKSMKEALEELS